MMAILLQEVGFDIISIGKQWIYVPIGALGLFVLIVTILRRRKNPK